MRLQKQKLLYIFITLFKDKTYVRLTKNFVNELVF